MYVSPSTSFCFLEKSVRKGHKQPRKTKNAIIVAMVTHPQIFTSFKLTVNLPQNGKKNEKVLSQC